MNVRRVRADSADPREYIDGANRAFGRWGDESMFAWAFRGEAELLYVDDERGRALAGSGINWRTLRTNQLAAIITASWTLPEARGQGLFTRLIDATCEIARDRDAVVLGFVRGDNVSARGLITAGAEMIPTFYCRTEQGSDHAERLESVDVVPSAFPSSFTYGEDEWRKQFLDRPAAEIECIGRRGEWAAVVERAAEFDRVHAVSDPAALPILASRAHGAGRSLFWFTTTRPAIDCEWTDGFLGVIPSSPLSRWELQNGDRM
ncbi:MAG TPA: GNAT family N-acetyltransferase [Thermoanaerobaculia bacterium]